VVDVTTVQESDRETVAMRGLVERLTVDGGYPLDEVDAAVARAVRRFAEAPIREFVPLLVERLVRDELRHLTPDEGGP
jgi:hypothetical protein